MFFVKRGELEYGLEENLEIEKIGLLSIEEYEKYKDDNPNWDAPDEEQCYDDDDYDDDYDDDEDWDDDDWDDDEWDDDDWDDEDWEDPIGTQDVGIIVSDENGIICIEDNLMNVYEKLQWNYEFENEKLPKAGIYTMKIINLADNTYDTASFEVKKANRIFNKKIFLR